MNKKPYTCFITCCQSSVPRGIALVPNFTFGNINNIPTVLFYEPAVYKEKIITTDKKNMDVTFKLEGNFPESGDLFYLLHAKSGQFYSSIESAGMVYQLYC